MQSGDNYPNWHSLARPTLRQRTASLAPNSPDRPPVAPSRASTFPMNAPDAIASPPAAMSPPSPRSAAGLSRLETDNLGTLTLPRPYTSSYSISTQQSADSSSFTKGSDIIRRLSRGAQNRLISRPSASNTRHRDQSSGPVVMRRKSDSRNMADSSLESLAGDSDSSDDLSPTSFGSSVFSRSGSVSSDVRWPPRKSSTRLSESDRYRPWSGSNSLNATLTKITKKKRKVLKFGLDDASAKLYWSHFASGTRKHIYIDDIKEIRAGDLARNYLAEFDLPADTLRLWFTIIYHDPERSKGRTTKAMHLITPDEQTCAQWIAKLQHLMTSRDDRMAGMAGNRDRPREEHWRNEMARKFGDLPHAEDEEVMDLAAIKATCHSFSINKSDQDLRSAFEASDKRKVGALDYLQYLEFFRLLADRKDIRRIFETIKGPAPDTISLEAFIQFLHNSQGIDTDLDRPYWEGIFEKLSTKKRPVRAAENGNASSSGMSCEAFRDFLLSSANSALESHCLEPCLHRPLNEYFISSSHNTYLLGRQVGGISSPEGYIDVLKKGCRCIEIDCWDGLDGNPDVTHGRTFSSRASFLDCIKTINQYAFWASNYPLIISLEVHCNPEQQRVMVDIMKKIFGAQLVTTPLATDIGTLPSPEDLKGKILIKVKESKSPSPSEQMVTVPIQLQAQPAPRHRRQRSMSAPDERALRAFVPHMVDAQPFNLPLREVSPRTVTKTQRDEAQEDLLLPLVMSPSASSTDESDVGAENLLTKKQKQKTSNIVKELGDLGIYVRGIKYQDFRSPRSKTYNHIFSFSEATFEEKIKTSEMKIQLERHNQRYLMRVYPRRTRVSSSNFDPLLFWRRGVQMAATNWQTYDLGTQINDAMFAAGSDRTGFVLKPVELRRSGIEGPHGFRPVKKKVEVKFSVQIISAQYLGMPANSRPDTEMNPYVEFEMYSAEDRAKGIARGEGGRDVSDRSGMSGIGSPLRKRTKIVERNGYDPVFNEHLTMTLKTKYPSLVFVRFTVWNSPDGRTVNNSKEPLSMFTAKLSSLQQGYRHLPLTNKNGEPVISKLFCKIQKDLDRDVEPVTPPDMSPGVEASHSSSRVWEDGDRPSKSFFDRVFNRTPSGRRKPRKETDQERDE